MVRKTKRKPPAKKYKVEVIIKRTSRLLTYSEAKDLKASTKKSIKGKGVTVKIKQA